MYGKKLFIVIGALFLFLMSAAFAENCCPPELNKITLQLQAESWATTHTADVTVTIDATLDKGDVSQLRDEIMSKLAKVAAGEWHITNFTQSQNESGLEQVQATAELRMSEKGLANVRTQAKNVSRAGLNFKVTGIDFSPSLAELEVTRNDLRSKIYAEVNAEIERLHKINPSQTYTIHAIDFMRFLQPAPMAQGAGNYMLRAVAYDKAAAAPMLSVSNKIVMQAVVELVPISK